MPELLGFYRRAIQPNAFNRYIDWMLGQIALNRHEGRIGCKTKFLEYKGTSVGIWNPNYSKDPKTGHSKSGIIQKPDIVVVRISNGRNCPVFKWSINPDRFINKEKIAQ